MVGCLLGIGSGGGGTQRAQDATDPRAPRAPYANRRGNVGIRALFDDAQTQRLALRTGPPVLAEALAQLRQGTDQAFALRRSKAANGGRSVKVIVQRSQKGPMAHIEGEHVPAARLFYGTLDKRAFRIPTPDQRP